MHCPRCGQQQVSEETKFCSRCGFQLSLVGELLHHGGTLPQLASIEQKRTFLNKKNGVGFSFIWLIFFLFLTAIWGILDVEELAGICAVTGIFGFVAIVIGSLIMLPSSRNTFYRSDLANAQATPTPLRSAPTAHGLPAPTQQPADVYAAPQGSWRSPETGELIQRGSVTDNTTKLLKRDE